MKIYDPNLAENAQVTLTPAALAYLQKKIKAEKALGLRLGVKKAGCSGYKYVIDYVHEIDKSDRLFSFADDVSVYIDNNSLPALIGIKIDYVQEGLNSKLKFINPNEKNACGCGESFSVE